MDNILYKNLINTISREIKKTLYEYEEFNNNNKFVVKVYDSLNIKDSEFISNNKKILWDFFDNGYKAAGLETFSNSCYDSRSLKKNTAILKVAYIKDNNEDIMIAAGIYSNYQKGNKCVGITATTDDRFRTIGKEAVKYIIKQDIGLYSNFYWGLFSDKVQHYYEKFGGVLVPNDYVAEFVNNAEPIKGSDYDILIRLRDGREVKKVIYGFNSKETYEKIIKLEDERVINALKRIKKHFNVPERLVESNEYINPDYYVNIVNLFYDDRNNGFTDLTTNTRKYLVNAKKQLETYITNNKDNISKENMRYYKLAIDNADDVLDTSTIMKLHIF